MRVEAQDPPWRVIRAFQQQNGTSLVHLHNVSGGVLAGDQLDLDVRVGRGAKAQLTSTGATRLYRHRDGAADSEQRISLDVEADGLLEHLPDMLIPFARSRHHQQTTVTLAEGATFFGWEVIAPGRQAMGELFAYESLRISTRVQTRQRPLLLEDYLLETRGSSSRLAAALGGYTHTVSFFAFQAGRPTADLRELERQMSDVAREESRLGCTIWGASALAADGVVVRGLSTTSRGLPGMLVRFWSTARRFLTGKDAVPPRKLK